MKYNRYLLGILLLMALGACATRAGEVVAQTSIAGPSASASTTSTPHPQATPSPTTVPNPTPDFMLSRVANGWLLSPAEDPDCHLPCWQGLRVGASTRSDVQAMFDTVFAFNGRLDFFSSSNKTDDPDLIISGTQAVGYVWTFRQPNLIWVDYEVHMLVDTRTGVLQGIRFLSDPGMSTDNITGAMTDPGYYQLNTPQEIIKALGVPDFVYAKWFGPMTFFYRDGVVAAFYILPTEDIKVVNGEKVVHRNYCFNTLPSVSTEYIMEPFQDLNDLDKLSPVQRQWLSFETQYGFEPLKKVFGVTPQQLADIALNDKNPCLSVNVNSSNP